MPNWCLTEYKLTGEDKEITSLYEKMKQLQEMKEPLKPNGFGTTWLGNLVEDLGVEYGKISCRGSWDNLSIDDEVLSFTTETAWYRCTEVEDLILEKCPSIHIAFRCEEPGMAIYEKNDESFFPEDYIIDFEDEDSDYYTEEDALKVLSEYFDDDCSSIKDAMASVDKYNENVDEENTDNHIWIREFVLLT